MTGDAMRMSGLRRGAAACACVLVWLSLVASGGAQRPGEPPWSRAVAEVFADWDRRDTPGCAVGVFQNGRIAYERGFGMADLEQDVPIAPDTVFYVGSLSKQFTAMAAALAIQQGALAAEDPIRTYLPELPDYAQPITVRHLVHHTSGLRDYNTLLSIAGRRGDEAYDNATVLRMTARQARLNFEPGEEYLYSNTGYTLLATIVERATGTAFAEYAHRQIFEPLGMSATHYGVDVSRIVPKRAHAYAPTGRGGLRLDTPRNQRAGAGGLFTTVRDLLRWDENFYDARVGGRTLVDRLQAVGSLNGGRPLSYAWGLTIGDYRGERIVEHGGSLGGYRAHLTRFPDQHTSVAALCNLATIAPQALVREVADVVLEKALSAPRPARRPARRRGPSEDAAPAPAPRDASSLAGTYRSDEIDATFTVSVEDGQLRLRREFDEASAPMEPAADGAFRGRGMTIRFEPPREGRSPGLTVDAGRVRNIRFERAGAR